jgi:hypothetical protein
MTLFDGDLGQLQGSSGHVGGAVPRDFEKWAGRTPTNYAWDFTAIALGVVLADRYVNRARVSADGWTREIDLTIAVSDPARWELARELVEAAISFLTGDYWKLRFINGGYHPRPPRRPAGSRPETCVSLLSGGLDSLIGALDLAKDPAVKPVFVTNTVRGDRTRQSDFADQVGAQDRFLRLNVNAVTYNVTPEISQRPRSLAFIAFGVMAATVLDRYAAGETIELHTPENGFISLNVPLTTLRRGSLSTRTTHPYFISLLQQLFDRLGLRVRLVNPYQFMTKGEMMAECKDQPKLADLAAKSMSCGRSGRTYTHCGRCLPCLVRRGAFLKWSGRLDGDATTYLHPGAGITATGHANSVFSVQSFAEYDDVMQCLSALDLVARRGSRRWIGPAITEATLSSPNDHRDVAARGLAEIGDFLSLTGLR